jgi:hypothetical protein
MQVAIPKRGEDLRMKHLASLEVLNDEQDVHGLHFLSSFTGVSYSQMCNFTPRQIKQMLSAATSAVADLNTSTEHKHITLGNKTCYRVDPEKVGIGWHIDFAATTDPLRRACLYYLPEGYNYSDADENGNLKHTIAASIDLFRAHLPLEVYLSASVFFLTKSTKSTNRQVLKLKTKNQIQKVIQKVIAYFLGKKVLTS